LRVAPGIVLRTSWWYAASGKNFVLTMLRLMKEKDRINVVCDQIGAPTWATSAAAGHLGPDRRASGNRNLSLDGSRRGQLVRLAVAIQDEALARGLLSRADTDNADSQRRVSDPSAAPGVQRIGQCFNAGADPGTCPALARHNLRTSWMNFEPRKHIHYRGRRLHRFRTSCTTGLAQHTGRPGSGSSTR